MNSRARRAAIYLPVATDNQTTDNRRCVLTEVAERRGWSVVATYGVVADTHETWFQKCQEYQRTFRE
jgi:DNA invertase Pin-like site-specific DNA recombinase